MNNPTAGSGRAFSATVDALHHDIVTRNSMT